MALKWYNVTKRASGCDALVQVQVQHEERKLSFLLAVT